MLDIAVQYDPATHTCDLVFNGQDFAVDTTPATRILLALGTDRRAHPDDTLPDALSETNPQQPPTLLARRGWPGDALDTQGRLAGSRWWLYQRSKHTEATRQGIESATVEALTPDAQALNLDETVTVRWLDRDRLGVAVQVGPTTITVAQPVT